MPARRLPQRPECIAAVASISLFACVPAVWGAGLSDLVHQFQSRASLQFTAAYDVWVITPCGAYAPPPDPMSAMNLMQPYQGRLEYLASEEKHRIRASADEGPFPAFDNVVAFDGKRFQFLQGKQRLLTHSATDRDTLLPLLPNPLLALLQFRHPITDDKVATEIRFKDVQRDAIPAQFWNVTWTRHAVDGRALDRAVFPGGVCEGAAYVHHVFAAPGAHHMPLRIDRVAENGRVLTTSDFANYRRINTATGPTYWPHRVVLSAFDNEGQLALTMSCTITQLELDAVAPRTAFQIARDPLVTVWDDDLRVVEQRSPRNRPIRTPHQTASRPSHLNACQVSGSQPSTRAVPDSRAIVRAWLSGDEHTAVGMFLELYGSDQAPRQLRLFDLSESKFALLPAHERESLKRRMLEVTAALHGLGRELQRRAAAADASGDSAGARRIRRSMRRFASANSGPEVSLLVDSIGRCYETWADPAWKPRPPSTSPADGMPY